MTRLDRIAVAAVWALAMMLSTLWMLTYLSAKLPALDQAQRWPELVTHLFILIALGIFAWRGRPTWGDE